MQEKAQPAVQGKSSEGRCDVEEEWSQVGSLGEPMWGRAGLRKGSAGTKDFFQKQRLQTGSWHKVKGTWDRTPCKRLGLRTSILPSS